jgi:putative endonuclease
MWSVYVLKSLGSGKIYTGSTRNLDVRLKRHNNELPHSKKSFTYKQQGPWIVVYCEKCNDMTSAHKREKYLKTGVGREFIHKQINLRP